MNPTEPRNEHESGHLTPEAERELAAIEKALSGQSVDPDLAELATLTEDLLAERPQPSEDWTAEMDAKAGRRFDAPRFGALGVLGRWAADNRSRLLGASAGLATLVVVGAVVIAQPDLGGSDDSSDSADITTAADSGDSAGSLESADAVTAEEALPETASGSNKAFGRPGERQSGGNAPDRPDRKQDRSAFLELKTETGDVRDVSDQAIQITESVGGVVISSNLSEGLRRSSADLELSIPTDELDATLDRLTDLATVETLNEASVDITAPFVSAHDRLKDARAERTKLLEALGSATTDTEAEAIRAQLDDVRREISRAKAEFQDIALQARNSQVSLRIEGTPSGGQADDGWTLGDAADDALSALKTIAGVLLVAGAILLPIAILAALIAAIVIALRRRRRERALDD